MRLTSPVLPGPLNEIKKNTVRAYWQDGIYDLFGAGTLALMGLWMHGLVVAQHYPRAAWFWPFTLQAADGFRWVEVTWALGGLLLVAVYSAVSYWLVNWLKQRWIVPIRGEIHHSFWTPVERSAVLVYVVGLVLGIVLLPLLNVRVVGSARSMAVAFTVSFAMLNLALGRTYHLKRYLVLAALGALLTIGAEWLLVVPIDLAVGPRSFWDAVPSQGHVLLNTLIWAGLYLGCGLYGLLTTLRMRHAD